MEAGVSHTVASQIDSDKPIMHHENCPSGCVSQTTNTNTRGLVMEISHHGTQISSESGPDKYYKQGGKSFETCSLMKFY